MTDTNQRSDNEAWLFSALEELEEEKQLAGFCRHIGMFVPLDATVIVEGIWPMMKAHYALDGDKFDAAQASRDMLSFAPMTRSISRHLKGDED